MAYGFDFLDKPVEVPCEKCREFYFMFEADETGQLIVHKGCEQIQFVPIEDLDDFMKAFPDTKIENPDSIKIAEVSETDLWSELLNELPTIIMYAPMFEPDRKNHIIKHLTRKYKISQSK